MTEKWPFPTESEVSNRLSDPASNPSFFQTISDLLAAFIPLNPSNLPNKSVTFIDRSVPNSMLACLKVANSSEEFLNLVQQLITNYISVIASLDIQPKMLSALVSVIPEKPLNFKPYQITQLDETEQNQMAQFPNDFPYLNEFASALTPIQNQILKNLFTNGVIRKYLQLQKEEKVTQQNTISMVSLCKAIYPFISPKIASYILPPIIPMAIDALGKNPDSQPLRSFLIEMIPMMPSLSKKIIEGFRTMLLKSGEKTRALTLTQLFKTAPEELYATAYKNLFIEVLSRSSSISQTLRNMAETLPRIATRCEIKSSDVCKLLNDSSHFEDFYVNLVIKLLGFIKDTKEKLANLIISSEGFSTKLTLEVLGTISGDKLPPLLFSKLMNSQVTIFSKHVGISLNAPTISKIVEAIQNKDYQLIRGITHFFYNAPYLPETSNFLISLANLSINEPSLLDLMDMFSNVLGSFDSKNLVYSLFRELINSISGTGQQLHPRFATILAKWISETPSIPDKDIFPHLMEIDFSRCPRNLPHLVTVIIQRATDNGLTDMFFKKLLIDTVPPEFAHWAIELLFGSRHHVPGFIKLFSKALVHHLNNPEKRVNASSMIYEAVRYEIDFCEGSEIFGLEQKFNVVSLGEEKASFTCHFNPMHSNRHIYWVVSQAFNFPISEFNLSVETPDGSTPILYGAPLTRFKFSNKHVNLVMTQVKKNYQIREIENPDFIDNLASSMMKHVFKSLIIEDFASSLLLQCMAVLPPPDFDDVKSEYPLQKVLTGTIEDPTIFTHLNRIFPLALKMCPNPLDREKTAICAEALIDGAYDAVSLRTGSLGLLNIASQIELSPDLLRKGMILSRSEIVRETILQICQETPIQTFIAVMPDTLFSENRSSTRQFFTVVEKIGVPSEVCYQFFKDLQQYEESYYEDPDETFISLLKLIPKNEETIGMVLEMITRMPTVERKISPFVFTAESREAAFDFLNTPMAIPMVAKQLESLPAIPSTYYKLNDDFTYKGRCGVYNLGSTCYLSTLLQCFNSLPNFVDGLLELHREELCPFTIQLRELIAKMQYGAEPGITIRNFAETLPNFDPSIQQDAEEIFNKMITYISEDLKDKPNPTHLFEFKVANEITQVSDGTVLSTSEEINTVLHVITKDIDDLDQAFQSILLKEVVEYKLESTGQTVKALRSFKIRTWPECLVIHMQRYDLMYEDRVKLINEFSFPIAFDPHRFDPDCAEDVDSYTLSGVVVHEGDVENGHYFTIVQGLDNEWYICNDHSVEYFDPIKLPAWAFGQTEGVIREKIMTAFLLFYRKVDSRHHEVKLDEELVTSVNTTNQQVWPTVVYFSNQYLSYIKRLVSTSKYSDESLDTLYTAFFRIAVVSDETLSDWCDFIKKSILKDEHRCEVLFNFIDKKLGKTFANIISLSDSINKNLTATINVAIQTLKKATYPIRILIKNTEEYSNRRSTSYILDIISTVCEFPIYWPDEDQTLLEMVEFMASDVQRDLMKTIAKSHQSTFEKMMHPFKVVLKTRGITTAVYALFNIQTINRISNSARKSDTFLEMLQEVVRMRPSMFYDQFQMTPATKSMFQGFNIPDSDPEMTFSTPIIDVSILYQRLSDIIFSSKQKTRVAAIKFVKGKLGPINDDMKKFLDNSSSKDVKRPEEQPESALAHFCIGLIGKAHLFLPDRCDIIAEYVDLMNYVSYIAPLSFATDVVEFAKLIPKINIKHVFETAIGCLIHLVAFDPTVPEQLEGPIIDSILECDNVGPITVNFLYMLGQHAEGSRLLNANVSGFLSERNDRYCTVLAKIVQESHPSALDVPESGGSFGHLVLANVLFDLFEMDRPALGRYMISVFRTIADCPPLIKSPITEESRQKVASACPAEYNEFVQNMVNRPWFGCW